MCCWRPDDTQNPRWRNVNIPTTVWSPASWSDLTSRQWKIHLSLHSYRRRWSIKYLYRKPQRGGSSWEPWEHRWMFEEVTKHGWDPMWTEVDRLINFTSCKHSYSGDDGLHSNICATAITPPDWSENISQSKVLHQSKQLYTIYCRFWRFIWQSGWFLSPFYPHVDEQRGPPQHLHACCPVGAGSSYPGNCVCAATQTRKLKRGFNHLSGWSGRPTLGSCPTQRQQRTQHNNDEEETTQQPGATWF